MTMAMAMLRPNGQLKNGDTQKACQKPALQQKTTDDDLHNPHYYPTVLLQSNHTTLFVPAPLKLQTYDAI